MPTCQPASQSELIWPGSPVVLPRSSTESTCSPHPISRAAYPAPTAWLSSRPLRTSCAPTAGLVIPPRPVRPTVTAAVCLIYPPRHSDLPTYSAISQPHRLLRLRLEDPGPRSWLFYCSENPGSRSAESCLPCRSTTTRRHFMGPQCTTVGRNLSPNLRATWFLRRRCYKRRVQG